MRDDLIFLGIPKWAKEGKATVKEFLQKHLKLLTDIQHLAEFMRQRIKAVVREKGVQPSTSKVYQVKWPSGLHMYIHKYINVVYTGFM